MSTLFLPICIIFLKNACLSAPEVDDADALVVVGSCSCGRATLNQSFKQINASGIYRLSNFGQLLDSLGLLRQKSQTLSNLWLLCFCLNCTSFTVVGYVSGLRKSNILDPLLTASKAPPVDHRDVCSPYRHRPFRPPYRGLHLFWTNRRASCWARQFPKIFM